MNYAKGLLLSSLMVIVHLLISDKVRLTAKMLPVEGIKASDLTVITPEEYARNYGDVDDAENPVL